jgi:hypothetical protein
MKAIPVMLVGIKFFEKRTIAEDAIHTAKPEPSAALLHLPEHPKTIPAGIDALHISLYL